MAYHDRMEVRIFSNSYRPGVGLKPRREPQRPLLPQHARHCPVLEAGEGLPGTHSIPIGQIFFVKREEITLRECSEEELEVIRAAKKKFFHDKAALRRNSAYGFEYSPLYARQSRGDKPGKS